MSDFVKHRRSAHNVPLTNSSGPTQQQQQQQQQPQSKKSALPRFPPLRHARTSTDSLSDSSPTNGSILLPHAASWSDVHDANSPYLACRRSANGHSRMQLRIPSRHGSLENLMSVDAAPRCTPEASTSLTEGSTAPPLRLPRRATVPETMSPSTAGLSGGQTSPSTARSLVSPPQTALAVARLRQAEAERSIDRSRSPSQDQTPAVNAHLRRTSMTQAGVLVTILPEDRRRGSVASQATAASSNGAAGCSFSGESFGSHPVTLVVNANGASGRILTPLGNGASTARPPVSPGTSTRTLGVHNSGGASLYHVATTEAAVAREEASVTRRRSSLSPGVVSSVGESHELPLPLFGALPLTSVASPLLVRPRRRRSDLAREPSTSPSVDSTAGEDAEPGGRGSLRPTSFVTAVESASKSPSSTYKRVHFNLNDPPSESSFLAGSLRINSEDGRAAHSSTRGAALNTSPLTLELSGTSAESGARPSFNTTDLRYSTGSSSCGGGGLTSTMTAAGGGSSSSRIGGSPMVAPAPPPSALSLRLSVKEGRVQTIIPVSLPATTTTTAAAAAAAHPASIGSSLSDAYTGATYTPQMPLPKPALKPYSRYNGERAESSSDSTPVNAVKKAAFAKGPPTTSAARGMLSSLRTVTARYRQRRQRDALCTASAGLTQPPPMVGPRRRSSEVVLKWSLLGFAALLSFLLILCATMMD